MNVLPDPVFVEIDPQKIEDELVKKYESLVGKTLYDAQIERQLINLIAYAKTRTLSRIQHAGEQMLVKTSSAPVLDYLADLVGVRRLAAQPSRLTVEFLNSTDSPVFVDTMELLLTSDASLSFITVNTITVQPRSSENVEAVCTSFGSYTNNVAIDDINALKKPIDGITIRNITVATGGADAESDDALKARVILAPEGFSTAGPEGAYVSKIKAVHQDIIDVAVLGPEDGTPPGEVHAYILAATGEPSTEMLQLVKTSIDSYKMRPLTDYFIVKNPERVDYSIDAEIQILSNVDKDTVFKVAQNAIKNYVESSQMRLGVDIIPSKIISVLHVPGVYSVDLKSPASKRVTKKNEWTYCTSCNIEIVGVVNE